MKRARRHIRHTYHIKAKGRTQRSEGSSENAFSLLTLQARLSFLSAYIRNWEQSYSEWKKCESIYADCCRIEWLPEPQSNVQVIMSDCRKHISPLMVIQKHPCFLTYFLVATFKWQKFHFSIADVYHEGLLKAWNGFWKWNWLFSCLLLFMSNLRIAKGLGLCIEVSSVNHCLIGSK